MMKLLAILILTILTLMNFAWGSEEFRRTISLEWEAIEDAHTYDVEISKVFDSKDKKGKPKVFNSKTTEWSGQLELGKYQLRVRGRDKRKAPGEWSENQEFFVGLDTPRLLGPQPDGKILTNETEKKEVTFKWEKVGGADEYQFTLKSEDGTVIENKDIDDTDVTLNLPVARQYIWSVSAKNKKGYKSDQPAEQKFSHWAAPISRPQVPEPTNGFVRELQWQAPEYADNYDLAISRYDEKTKKWEIKDKKTGLKETRIPFSEQYSGGQYKISIRANAPLRQSSKVTEMKFPVVYGKRTPAAEEIATVRESIDRTSGWFGIASYLITIMSFKGVDSDNGGIEPIIPEAVGGTGRFGAGYLSPKSNWGFLGIIDYSGFIVETKIKNYGSAEGNAVYRTNFGERFEVRQQIGGFTKEFPVFINGEGKKVTTMGPHYGVEYWQAVSSKFGYQMNAHLYLNLVKIDTPNGNEIVPDMSYQLGFMGSYRLSKRATGLFGYAFRQDSAKYKSNFGGNNSSSITGNYLNLFLEWSL